MIVMLALGLVACGSNRQEQMPVQTTESDRITTEKDTEIDVEPITEASTEAESDRKTLVVYYSNTGTTRGVAETIAEYTGGDLAEIQRVTPYENVREDAEKEIEDGVFPEITLSIDSIAEYDTINTAMLSMVAEQRNVYAAESRMNETPIKQGKGR